MKATIVEGLTMMADMDYAYPTNIPVPVSAEIGTLADDIIVVTFDQTLNNATLPAITCFDVTGAYLNAQVSAVAIVGDEVRLTLDNDARCDNVITLDYTVPPTNGIRNLSDTYAESFTGMAVTNLISFALLTDLDCNVYNTVIIGTQEWTVEGLRVTQYSDGTPIPNLTNDIDWSNDLTGAYRWYDNNIANKAIYGALYNRYAVQNLSGLAYLKRYGVQEAGWRVATDADWTTLATFAGGLAIAGGKLKEVGVAHWNAPNTGATDLYGFKALPGGYVTTGGVFTLKNQSGYYWGGQWFRLMIFNDITMTRTFGTERLGMSVKCVRDI